MTTPACRNNAPLQVYERSARLNCVVAPSPLLRLLLLLAAFLAVLLIWLCELPLFLSWFFSALVLVYTLIEWRRVRALKGVLSTRERKWFWCREGQGKREFQFVGELVLWRWLVVINGRDAFGHSLRLVLARDMLEAGDWRRLQVALRFSR
ncbi:protein YgfX [Microbulbifer sp. ANSA003]|uniref:protein YgfX n=1 Tax=Microbulbifer sp. ANSA003 TaxID=3243360 RepID=UPI004042A7D3